MECTVQSIARMWLSQTCRLGVRGQHLPTKTKEATRTKERHSQDTIYEAERTQAATVSGAQSMSHTTQNPTIHQHDSCCTRTFLATLWRKWTATQSSGSP